MTLTQLLERIFTVYQNNVKDTDMRDANRQLDSLMRILTETQRKITASPSMARLSNKTASILTRQVEGLVELVDSESFPVTDERQDFLATLADNYVGAVKKYTQSGSTGFYDAALRIYVTYDHDVDTVAALATRCQEKGMDIQLIDTFVNGNPERSQYRTSAILTFLYPTSHIAALHDEVKALQEDRRINIGNYFIAPSLYDAPADMLAFVKQEQVAFAKTDMEDDTVLDAVTLLGLCRVEFTWCSEFDPIKPVIAALRNPDLYRRESDHVNGMMPTRMCYDENECDTYLGSERYQEDNLPRRTMRDEVTLFEAKTRQAA